MLLLAKKSLVKGKYETVRCRDATASSFVTKVRREVFTHFHTIAMNHHSSMRIDCLACEDELFMNIPLDVKRNYEHALDFSLHLSPFFQSQ
jgi:hypothetical protein